MERKIEFKTKTGHSFYKWNALTPEERLDNCRKTNMLFSYLMEHKGQLVTYEQMNKMGLNHLYAFKVNDWNIVRPSTPITITDEGVVINA